VSPVLTVRDRLAIGLPVAGLALLAVVPPSDDGITICPIALTTGMACPGCGMTRAISHLLRGDLATSWSFHPLAAPVLVVLAAVWVWFTLVRLGRVEPASTRFTNSALVVAGIALAAVWVARLAAGTLPPV
jgi:hypothetical protein